MDFMANFLAELIRRQAEKYGDREVFRHRNYETSRWESTSWNSFSEQVTTIARAMATVGIKEQENIATYTQNTPEVLILDFAAYYNRAVIVPLYPTSSVEQVEYILNETEARYIFVGEQAQYDNALLAMKNCAALRQIVVLDKHVKLSAEDTQSIYFMDI